MNPPDSKFVCEFEVPPHTKVRVVATVDRKLCEQMELIHKHEIDWAKAEEGTEPDWSNTIKMLLQTKAYLFWCLRQLAKR